MEPRDARAPQPGDPRFVPGIYNYCDRWCERCAFTARCYLYASTPEEPQDEEAPRVDSPGYWQFLHRQLQQTVELLKQEAVKWGIDPSELDEGDVEVEPVEPQPLRLEQGGPLGQLALSYAEAVAEWFDDAPPVEEIAVEWLLSTAAPSDEAARQKILARVADAIEVIRWDQHHIAAKVFRATSHRDDLEPDARTDAQSDANGSAKVALLGIARSVDAWVVLRGWWPGRGDAALRVLAMLDRLRRTLDHEFPRARQFKRPGFDDP